MQTRAVTRPIQWREQAARVEPVDGAVRVDYHGGEYAGASVLAARSGALRFERTAASVGLIRRRIALLRVDTGGLLGTFGETEAELGPGSTVLYDTALPARFECLDDTTLLGLAVDADRVTGTRPGGFGTMWSADTLLVGATVAFVGALAAHDTSAAPAGDPALLGGLLVDLLRSVITETHLQESTPLAPVDALPLRG